MLLAGLLSMVCSAYFLQQPGTTWLGMAPFTEGWALSYQSLVKKMSSRVAYRQSDEDILSMGFSSQTTLTCVTFTKNKINTKKTHHDTVSSSQLLLLLNLPHYTLEHCTHVPDLKTVPSLAQSKSVDCLESPACSGWTFQGFISEWIAKCLTSLLALWVCSAHCLSLGILLLWLSFLSRMLLHVWHFLRAPICPSGLT